jgi:hypothetical protein
VGSALIATAIIYWQQDPGVVAGPPPVGSPAGNCSGAAATHALAEAGLHRVVDMLGWAWGVGAVCDDAHAVIRAAAAATSDIARCLVLILGALSESVFDRVYAALTVLVKGLMASTPEICRAMVSFLTHAAVAGWHVLRMLLVGLVLVLRLLAPSDYPGTNASQEVFAPALSLPALALPLPPARPGGRLAASAAGPGTYPQHEYSGSALMVAVTGGLPPSRPRGFLAVPADPGACSQREYDSGTLVMAMAGGLSPRPGGNRDAFITDHGACSEHEYDTRLMVAVASGLPPSRPGEMLAASTAGPGPSSAGTTPAPRWWL